jgi:uncharacterized membrane protein (DUF106 family)
MPGEHEEIKKLLEANLEVVKQNHEMLEKIHRVYMYTFWMKALWFAIIIGVPFLVYYVLLEPYVAALGIDSEQFTQMMRDLPKLISSPVGKMMQ